MDEISQNSAETSTEGASKLTAPARVEHSEKAVAKPRERSGQLISYEWLVWLVFGAVTIVAVVDRFTTNVWPRQTYSIGAGSAGTDFTDGLKPGPWSVKLFDAVARISGRYSIVALNLLLFTAMKTTESLISESWIARKVVDCSDIHEANRRIHKWNGIALIVWTLVHVWSIFTPVIFHGYAAKVVLGTWEWIASERAPAGFKDINPETEIVMLQGDDVFRLVEMTLLLAILMPLSLHWLSTRWHIGVHLHSIISTLYFIDIVRRHTHPHSWILNTPFFVLWIIDIVVGMYWRRQRCLPVGQIHLSRDYMILLWNQFERIDAVGPKYYLRLRKHSTLERPHVFTAFENHCGLDMNNGLPWSVGIVTRVYHDRRRPALGRKDKISHTHRIAESTDMEVDTWGPFNGSMTQRCLRALAECQTGVVLVAGGSAVAYLLDALQQPVPGDVRLSLLFTTRDEGLFEWVLMWMAQIVRKKKEVGNISIILALTGGSQEYDKEGDSKRNGRVDELKSRIIQDLGKDSTASDSSRGGAEDCSILKAQGDRIDFRKELNKGNEVYFQGGGALQRAVASSCKRVDCKFIAGPAFDEGKPAQPLPDNGV